MIYTTNLRGEILDVNQAGVELLGFQTREDLLQQSSIINFYQNAEDREKFIKLIDREGYVKDFEVDFKKCDGSYMRVLISSRRYENSETGDVEYEGIIKDITRS